MIFDDVADIMRSKTVRQIRRMTGLSNDKIYRIMNGLPFIVDYNTVFALQRMGYEIKVKKLSHETEH